MTRTSTRRGILRPTVETRRRRRAVFTEILKLIATVVAFLVVHYVLPLDRLADAPWR
jgi:hypothetical protein